MGDSISQIENQLLVMAAQDANAAAMDELVCRWQKKLWCYVYRLTNDEHGAWDITQECWLAIIKGIRKLDDPASFKAWAYRIATNESIDWMKRRSKYRHIHSELIQSGCDQEQEDQQIKEMVSGLKEVSRVVLGLYYFEQLSVGEISEVLKVPAGTVKSRLFKARADLKQLWERLRDEPYRREENEKRTAQGDH